MTVKQRTAMAVIDSVCAKAVPQRQQSAAIVDLRSVNSVTMATVPWVMVALPIVCLKFPVAVLSSAVSRGNQDNREAQPWVAYPLRLRNSPFSVPTHSPRRVRNRFQGKPGQPLSQ